MLQVQDGGLSKLSSFFFSSVNQHAHSCDQWTLGMTANGFGIRTSEGHDTDSVWGDKGREKKQALSQ